MRGDNMPPTSFVVYCRVSTEGQGRSGLGLEAQHQAVAAHVAHAGGQLIAKFQEVESGRKSARLQFAAALACCRTRRAVLLVAKLDRLARDARSLLGLVEGTGEAGVVFCDLPQFPLGPVGKFMLTQMAAVAELEAGLTNQRTRAALAAAKARGTQLGNPRLRRARGWRRRSARMLGRPSCGLWWRGYGPRVRCRTELGCRRSQRRWKRVACGRRGAAPPGPPPRSGGCC